MNTFNVKLNKWSILSLLLVVCASVLGADGAFAMAVDVATDGSGDVEVQDQASLEASMQTDTSGLKTQQQGSATTATDARDKGLEAEDIDPRVAKFRPFRFPIEWYIANKCKQVPSKSYEHTHFRSGATVLEDTYNGSTLTFNTKVISAQCSDFENDAAALTECSEVFIPGVDGYADDGVTIDGDLTLYVASNDGDTVKMVALNAKASGVSVPAGSTFVVGATACSESQMNVAPESYLPDRDTLFLQKKNANVIITDEWKEMAKKVPFITEDVLHNGLFNYKRKCARTHWLGRQKRIDVKVKELNGQVEAVYFERGILRQIPMVYSYNGSQFEFTDFMGMTRLMFAHNSENNKAVAFCGLEAFNMFQEFAFRTSVHNGSVKFENIEEMGIKVQRWSDALGSIDFVHDPTLDDINYGSVMAIIDIENAVRYYKRNEQQTKQDMKKTGEAREAERTRISMIDCIGLKGYNAVLVCPASKLSKVQTLGGVQAYVTTADAQTTLDKAKKYYLSAARDGFQAGTIIEYDADLKIWKEFEGNIYA